MAKAEDLTGRRFGLLTVIRRVENRNGRVCWECRCDCGREKTVTAHDLKCGKCKTCGDASHRKGIRMINLAGHRFGRLRVEYPTEKRDYRGCVCWHCRCDCGNELDISETSLTGGNYQSCGCLRKELGKELSAQLTRVDGTCIEILENRKYRRDNKSGFRGVFLQKNQKYRVMIGFKGKRYYLGTYDDYENAVRARLEAEVLVYDGFLKAYRRWKAHAETDPEWAKMNPLIYEVEKRDGHLIVKTD